MVRFEFWDSFAFGPVPWTVAKRVAHQGCSTWALVGSPRCRIDHVGFPELPYIATPAQFEHRSVPECQPVDLAFAGRVPVTVMNAKTTAERTVNQVAVSAKPLGGN